MADTTYWFGETVDDHPLPNPVGFVHFDSKPSVKRGIILDDKPTPQELRDFWTNSLVFRR